MSTGTQDERFTRPATSSPDLVVEGGRSAERPPDGGLRVPGDKSITHRALLAALLPGAAGVRIARANLGGAVRALLPALRALGYRVDEDGDVLAVRPGSAPVPQAVRPHPGVSDWPDLPYLQTEGSSAAARLLIGLLAGTGTAAVVDGDDVLRHRPMEWLVEPLRELGARIDHLGEPGRLPVAVRGPVHRSGTVELAVGSAQARAGVLLAAAAAGVPATVRVPVRSRDHTERMLSAFGAVLAEAPSEVSYLGGACRVPEELEIPGDPSLAAYPAAAHLLWGDGGELRIRDVCLNPTRLGFFEVLREAGADIGYEDERTWAVGERVGTVVVRGGLAGVRGVRVEEPAVLHALIDEVPLLTVVAAALDGPSWIGCAEELRFKETDRLVTTAAMACAFGAEVAVESDGLRVAGGRPLRAGAVPGYEDHRIAMAAATLACALPGRTTVSGGGCHRTSFPDFTTVLRSMGARITTRAQNTEGVRP